MAASVALDEFGNPIEDKPADHDLSGLPTAPEVGGMATPKGGWDRTRFRDAWMSSGESLDDFVKNHPDFATGVTINKDRATLPGGEVLDLVGDIGGANTHEWTGTGYNASGVADAPASSWMAASSTPAPPTTAPTAIQLPPEPGGTVPLDANGHPMGGQGSFQDQIRKLLMEQLGTLSKPVDANDPTIKAQTDAYNVTRQRSADRERQMLAERAAASGLNSGGAGSGSFDTGLQGIQEQTGQDEAGFGAGLVGRELESRRTKLQTLLAMAVQSGDNESARALQAQLAKMNDQLVRAQMAQQGGQFGQDLAYRYANMGQQGSQYDRDLAYRYANLGQQGNQYNDTMGWNINRSNEDDYRWRILLGLGG